MNNLLKEGIVTKLISNQYTVRVEDKLYVCIPRGKVSYNNESPIVGDIVLIDTEKNTIESINPRKNRLNRPVVANVDIALILTSVKKPDLSLNLLDKLLVVITSNNIKPIICLSKIDLLNKEEKKNLNKTIKDYKKIGFQIVKNTEIMKIKRLLKGKIVVLTGQTGAGKSTLLNNLDKSLDLKTSPISDALNRGVHTTRHVELYNIKNIFFVDTPGFSSIDLKDISTDELKNSFKEFSKYPCEYKNCLHDLEKNCLVKENVEKGNILKSRYENYILFLKEIYESSSKLYK
ncbi:MAG: ribosome small subunit-dependent GTPase A [Bacilli bacterium]